MVLPVAVLVGGRGTRVSSVAAGVPKALLEVAGRPFIDFKLAGLAAAGVTDVVMLAGVGADALRAHVGDGQPLGLRVEWSIEPADRLLGTGGALRSALPLLPATFWVTYGDTLLDVPLAAAEAELERSGARGLMTVLENRDRWQTSNVDVDAGRVTAYEKDAAPGTHRYLDYGMMILDRAACESFAAGAGFDLGGVVRLLIDAGALASFEVDTPFRDVGTVDAWRATDRWATRTRAWEQIARTTPGPRR